MGSVLRIDPDDDVAVALTDLLPGDRVEVGGQILPVRDPIRMKHKIALRDIHGGERVRMYGVVVGEAVQSIPIGGGLTRENLQNQVDTYRLRAREAQWAPPDVGPWRGRTFSGYIRSDGRIGTANHWIVVPLVFCENRNVQVLRRALAEALGYERPDDHAAYTAHLIDLYQSGASLDEIRSAAHENANEEARPPRLFPNVDGIKILTHDGGCGGTPDDAAMLVSVLAAYIDHPNVGGATVLSLGCQNAQVAMLERALHSRNPRFDKPLVVLEQQRMGTEERLMRTAVAETFAGLMEVNTIDRSPASLDRLVFGVECGGSDGFSGISANPVLGHAADLLVALGGSVVLSEFPELWGVEQSIIDRCVNSTVAERFVQLQEAYATRAEAVGASFDMNPSAGNIRDGLLTDAMKSAGAVRKGGTSPVVDVLDYGESIRRKGLSLLCTPGNDVESTTGLAAAGATVLLFSTGLGTPTGNPIVPTVKVSSNSQLAQRMPDIIDLDAGPLLTGTADIESLGADLLNYVLQVADGSVQPAAVRLAQDDFLPWKRGISL